MMHLPMVKVGAWNLGSQTKSEKKIFKNTGSMTTAWKIKDGGKLTSSSTEVFCNSRKKPVKKLKIGAKKKRKD